MQAHDHRRAVLFAHIQFADLPRGTVEGSPEVVITIAPGLIYDKVVDRRPDEIDAIHAQQRNGAKVRFEDSTFLVDGNVAYRRKFVQIGIPVA